MQEAFDRRWTKLAQEVLSGMRDWRVQHPIATFAEIEKERPHCPTCGGELHERGKQVRKLTTHGDQTVHLTRSYGSCPTCGVSFFPPG
jgi:YgiT-type zinc finger domain-containing protein